MNDRAAMNVKREQNAADKKLLDRFPFFALFYL